MALQADIHHRNLTGLLDRLRYQRSPAEIALVRQAAAIADVGVEAGIRALAIEGPGIRSRAQGLCVP
jgi:Xaa-Pro aminopeptidase